MTTPIGTTIVTNTEHQIPGALLQKKVRVTRSVAVDGKRHCRRIAVVCNRGHGWL